MVPLFYPTAQDADWDSQVDARLLRFIAGYNPGGPLYNRFHLIPVAPRTRLDVFQNTIRTYKMTVQGYWTGLTVTIVTYDRESARSSGLT
jgi:hypothetical protein